VNKIDKYIKAHHIAPTGALGYFKYYDCLKACLLASHKELAIYKNRLYSMGILVMIFDEHGLPIKDE
jgi:hypothetical protein